MQASVDVKQEDSHDDEIQEVDSLISLNCPLSTGRIEIATRGKSCTHTRCFDLETYLLFSDDAGVWQVRLSSCFV